MEKGGFFVLRSQAMGRAGWYGCVWPSSPGWRYQGFPRTLGILDPEFLASFRSREGWPLFRGIQSLGSLCLFQLRFPGMAVLTPSP